MSGAKVLVVDDEPKIRRSLRVALRANGYAVAEAATGEAALDEAAAQPPEIIILDLGLPDVDGVEVCQRLREWTHVPVIVLSALGDDDAKVRALDQGADDYITKPFSMPELLARMRVALRHAALVSSANDRVLHAREVEIDLARRLVTRSGELVHVTPTEYSFCDIWRSTPGESLPMGSFCELCLAPGMRMQLGACAFTLPVCERSWKWIRHGRN